MPNLSISAADLPAANLASNSRLYAGCGWLTLVHETMITIGGSEIVAIREDAGGLRIELRFGTPEQQSMMREIEQRSRHVYEICGVAGELRYDGLVNGRPAGWHRARCEKHVDTRTRW